jgi:putative thioredoxin
MLHEQTASAPSQLITDTTTQGFRQDVIAESAKQPVLVDFWAPWCGPCKQLTPIIEKVVKAANGKVKLVKMNIDDHPQIPGQLGIQSIPAVIAFKQGQPVDGFMGAQPESQIQQFIERLVGPSGPSPIDQALDQAEAAAGEGDVSGAAEIYGAVLAQEPDNTRAMGGLIRMQVEIGALEQAARLLDTVPPAKHADPAIAAAKAALELAQQAHSVGDLAELSQKVEAEPGNHQARFDLAVALNAKGQREEAIDQLVTIIKRDRAWNEEAARKQLLQFFEAWGPMDEMSILGRRKLSAVLYS